jgi:hypothetical protein|tara:strand:- start:257 stop:577 length:321 start_codon:yes stop_codon:yes gene_type:complete
MPYLCLINLRCFHYEKNKSTKGKKMDKIDQIILNELPNTTPVNDQKRIIDINKIDVAYRELEDNDNQYEIMKYILSCLSDQQIKETKKILKVWKQFERKLQKARNN